MLIAEELLLVGTDPEGRNLLSSHRNLALAGAYLSELSLQERLMIDERKRLAVVEGGSTGSELLDRALVLFGERAGKKPKDVLEKIGKQLLQPTLDSLVRQELVRPEPVKVVGIPLGTRWPAQTAGPRDRVLDELVQVLTGAREPDGRTGALVSVVHAVEALPRVVPKERRPGLTNRDVKRRGKEVLEGRWASQAVVKAVQEAAAAVMAATAAAAAASSGSN